MNFPRATALRAISFVLLLLTLARTDSAISPEAKTTEVVRVGITEYQNLEESYQRYEEFFRQLASATGQDESVTFEIAIGTYGEVLDWYNTRKVDVAILSAMPVADLLLDSEDENLKKAYLGDLSVTFQSSSSQRTLMDLFPSLSQKDPFKYRTGCIVLNSDKELNSLSDIKRLWEQGQVKFLFVRPYSMSGYIVPLHVLRGYGIDALKKPEQLEFTYQHGKSLSRMMCEARESNPQMHLVAFVLDDTRYDPTQDPNYIPSQQIFHRIDISELDSYSIPREIMLANYHQEIDTLKVDKQTEQYPSEFAKHKALMNRLIKNWQLHVGAEATRVAAPSPDAPQTMVEWKQRPDNWLDDYAQVKEALKDTSLPRQLLYKSNFDDFVNDLETSKKRGRFTRLALVLSGGGAKCAYQAGAIVEIEKKLKNQDIDLVVGTSGGAINALLAALKVTKTDNAASALSRTWQSFRQQQFLRPSRRFNFIFGLCFGLLQALLINVAVLLFGRNAMNWRMTGIVLLAIGLLEILIAFYFRVMGQIVYILLAEVIVLAIIVATVLIVGWLVELPERLRDRKATNGKNAAEKNCPLDEHAKDDRLHWRKLTIALMIVFSLLEVLFATIPSLGSAVSDVFGSHWLEHVLMLMTLMSLWSFPYPLIIALAMGVIGWLILRPFDWNRWREPFVWWMMIFLVVASILLVLEGLFKESSPSRAIGIEEAFTREIPSLVRDTVAPNFVFKPEANKTPLESLSQQLMDANLLQRDLLITTSKLPVTWKPTAKETSDDPEREGSLINSLPDDLYFYFRKPGNISPPPDRSFVPLIYNQDKLLDIVIGSSTIYPIFPSRSLKNIKLGSEASHSKAPIESEMRIIDGGFIHNIPVKAASDWGATHIILIEASPVQQQRYPRDFWDNVAMAFGYLFSQAQRSDTQERGRAETFVLRPTSECERLNIKPICTDEDGPPEPDMDTFDFSRKRAERAFAIGESDVRRNEPLFTRLPGAAPMFRTVTANNRTSVQF